MIRYHNTKEVNGFVFDANSQSLIKDTILVQMSIDENGTSFSLGAKSRNAMLMISAQTVMEMLKEYKNDDSRRKN